MIVAGVVDPSDRWSRFPFHLTTEWDAITLDVAMQSSGFEVTDAEPLRGLVEVVYSGLGPPLSRG